MHDYASSVIDRTDRMKRRWMRVIENKERLQVDSQRQLKLKYDKVLKMDKSRRKRAIEDLEDAKLMNEKHKEKFNTVVKRRDHQKMEFEQALRKKEEHY
jgi:hypothetical protein